MTPTLQVDAATVPSRHGGESRRIAIAWGAAALIAHAAALRLVDAGKECRYQHLTVPPRGWPAWILLAAAAAVVIGLSRVIKHGRFPVARWRAGAAAAVLAALAATPSRDLKAFASEEVLSFLIQAVIAGAVVLAVLHAPSPALPRLRPAVLAIWVFLFTAGAAVLVYERHPHIQDEVSYLIQARYLAAGRISMPAPPAPRAFHLDLMTYEPSRWYSPFPPGWPAVLAAGVLLGFPWLVNPLLSALNLVLARRLARDLFGERVADIAALLLAVSPWFLFMGMSLMSHTVTLTLALMAALSVSRARETGSARYAGLGGLAVGAASLARPLDGAVLALAMGVWLVSGAAPKRLIRAGAFAAAMLIAGSLALPYNRALTGNALKFPVDDYFDRYYHPGVNRLGFGPDRGLPWQIDPFPGHGLRDVLANADLNLTSINWELFGWGCGSLLPIVALFFSGRAARKDWMLLAVAASVAAAYSFYWFSGGPDFGARYWFLAIVPLVFLTARALDKMGRFAGPALACLCLLAVVNYLPWRGIDKYYHYLNMRPDVRRLAAERQFGPSLVFIRGPRHPDYASAAVYNPLDLRAAAPIYAWDRDPAARAEARRAYPDRAVWLVNGPSVTGRGFEVAAGPLPPGGQP